MRARAARPRSPNFGRPEKAAYSLAARPTASTAHVNFYGEAHFPNARTLTWRAL